jgi:hydroxymethylpyrimidine/phosphomethylpyrimidine kinase / thiaminase
MSKLVVVLLNIPRYVLDIGQSEDWLGLQIALAPCLLGYGAVAKLLYSHSETITDGNHYWPWIENYVAEDYVTAVKTGSGTFLLLDPEFTKAER